MKTNLITIAKQLLEIQEEYKYHLNNPQIDISQFDLETFEQMWGNTSGGFEGMGGCAMTSQRTYVLIPYIDTEDCQVYFQGTFAYSVPYSEEFMNDVKNRNVAGLSRKNKYFKKENK